MYTTLVDLSEVRLKDERTRQRSQVGRPIDAIGLVSGTKESW